MTPDTVWRDDLTVTIRLLEGGAGGSYNELWVIDFGAGTLDDARLPFRELVDALNEKPEERPPFYLESRETHMSWGASGASEAIALGIAANMLTAPCEAALRAAFHRIAAAITRSPFEPPPVTAEEAEHRARWFAISHFELDCQPADLDLRAATDHLDHDAWAYTFGHAGTLYDVELVEHVGLATFVKVTRRADG